MPPALDRLLAGPSASRLLRCCITATRSPYLFRETAECCLCRAPRRHYSWSPHPEIPKKWRRWKEKTPKAQEATVSKPLPSNDIPICPGDEFAADEWLGGGTGDYEKPDEGALWAQRLQREERLHGLNGIRRVWNARRGFDLPTFDTPDAEFLWGTFIKVPDLVLPVISHAAELYAKTNQAYPHLYELCMSYWLPQEQHVHQALDYHHQMLRQLKLQTLPLRQLARAGRQRFTPRVFDAFMDIYRSSKETNVYDEIIPALSARGSVTMARQWHILCLHRGDMPSATVASHPVVKALMAETATSPDPEARFLTTIARHRQPNLNEDLLRRLQGRDTAPVRFEDSFCARMFATRAFPPESVIKGLAMVGVNEIGPQAVRAMASRVNPISDLPSIFEELRGVGITLQPCVFSMALEKFAHGKQWNLVSSILQSDQHQEVYDDAKLQRNLLDYYLQQQDWRQAHRTLAILSLFHNDVRTESWNLLLQAWIRHFDPHKFTQTLQDMRARNIAVTPDSIAMIQGCLRSRRRGKRPHGYRKDQFDDIRFVARTFIAILEGGIGFIPPLRWREIIRRYGMLGRFREMRRLVFWLLSWYAPRGGSQFDTLPKSEFLDSATQQMRTAYPDARLYFNFPGHKSQRIASHPLTQLFPPSFLQGLIVWGFRASLLPDAPYEASMIFPKATKQNYRRRLFRKGVLRPLEWSVGLRVVVDLRDLGLYVHHDDVIKALQMVFINLFGSGRSNKLVNRAMEAANTLSYFEYVREVNKIWGSSLLPERHSFGRLPSARRWHPRFPRVVHRKDTLGLGDLGLDPVKREPEGSAQG